MMSLRFSRFLGLYLAYTLIAFNGAFFAALFSEMTFFKINDLIFAASLLWVALGLMTLVLLGALWPYTTKPVAIVLLFGNAAALYFSEQYQIVINREMLLNTLETDHREVFDLLTPRLFAYLLVLAALPALIIARLHISYAPIMRGVLARLIVVAIILVGSGVLVAAQFKSFATHLRVHHSTQNLWIPRNYLWGAYEAITGQYRMGREVLPIARDAQRTPHVPPLLVVVVIGETARAANFSLYGYGRETNPKLARLPNLLKLSVAQSCGTSTAVSLPCMFSHLAREDFAARPHESELLPLILARLGVDVRYFGNNFGGCKGLCAHVTTEYTRDADEADYCNDFECHDAILIDRLKRQLSSGNGDQLILLHQNGSHGPRYDKRYPRAFAHFKPECLAVDIRDCSTAELVNSYDNSLLYTDHVLAGAIGVLAELERASVLIYLSDHGESLGENGVYLHGLPYGIAPRQQREVPFLIWTSEAFRAVHDFDAACITTQEGYRHAHLFHTLAGLFGVDMVEYQPQWDIFRRCAIG